MRLIAHRGASGHAPENTMAAFRLAIKMGATAIELDAHQSKDHELVVIHDEDLRRTAGRRCAVARLSLKDLSQIDVGSWFGRGFAAERVPRLEEVFDLCEGKAELHVEIKRGSAFYPGIEERVVALIASRKAWAWTVVSSFDHAALHGVRAIDAKVRLGYLLGWTRLPVAYEEMRELGAESLNLSRRQVNARKVHDCHQRGHKVLVYTVNTQADLDRMAGLGVDGVFSNFPELKAP